MAWRDPCFCEGMSRRQAVLAQVIEAREIASRRSDLLSLTARQHLYDLEAELESIEHLLVSGREMVSDAVLQRAVELTRGLLALVQKPAAA
jgi:hypothetical protein